MPLNVTEKKRKRQEAAAVEAIAKAARAASDGGLVASDRGQTAEEELASLSSLPTIVVFDLDDTLWVGDIDMTSGSPFKTEGRGLPVLAQKGGHGDKVVPFPHVPEIFDWLEVKGIKVAISTHTFKPSWAEEVLSLWETGQGTKYTDLLVCPVGSDVQRKNKDVHMRAISTATGCSCSDMVFFDDKDHNVKDARRAGVTSCMVSSEGLTWDKFVQCLRDFEQKQTGGEDSYVPQSGPPKAVVPKAAWASQSWATQYGSALPKPAMPRPITPGWKPAWASRPQRNLQMDPQLANLASQMGWAPY